MLKTIAIATLALTSAPALAQTAAPAPAAPAATAPATATPTVGAMVYDPTGGDVGTVTQLTPEAAVIDTGAHKAAVPLSAFSTTPKGLTITLTKVQLDEAAAAQQAQAATQLKSLLVTGTQVRGSGGTPVGTIKAVTDQAVTLTTPKGDVALPVAGFGQDANGLIIGMTSAQLDAAISAAAPAKPK